MRYILVENSNSPHEEGLIAILNVLKTLGRDTTVFLGASHVDRAKQLGIHDLADRVITLKERGAWLQLLRYRQAGDRVLYNTTSVRRTVFVFVTSFGRGKNIYYIRNANSWMRFSTHFTRWRDYLPRLLSTAMKKYLFPRAHFVIAEFDSIRRYIEANSRVRVDVIPFKNYHGTPPRRDSGRVHLVVPGVVDFRTKDITTMVNAIRLLPPTLRDQVKLTLLGRTASAAEEKQCLAWKAELGDAFVYHSGFVPVTAFSEAFETADAVICCFVLEHRCAHFSETYGTSRGSGVVAHAFARALPLIVNEGFAVDAQYARATRTFRSAEDLASILTPLASDRETLRAWQRVAEAEAASYSLESVTKKLHYLTEEV
ncbi:hypothetical protein EBR44_03410 [bacterium]|nr:hypothetical protein [bacterium]